MARRKTLFMSFPQRAEMADAKRGSSGNNNGRHRKSNSSTSNSGNQHVRRDSRGNNRQPGSVIGGTDASIHAPNASSGAGSTLNPNAGGFQPGGLSSLPEVQNEVLITPTMGHFNFEPNQSQNDLMNNPLMANQLAQINQLQMMQQTLNQANSGQINPSAQQQLLDMQTNLLAQLQLASGSAPRFDNTPPRFQQLQQQQPAQDMGSMMAEQMQIQQQLELLRAQQDALLSRFAEIHTTSGPVASTASTGFAPNSFARSTGPSHRRHQSQQVSSTPAAFNGSMGNFSQPGGFTFGTGSTDATQAALPKGHGRRHSVNVLGNTSAASNPSNGSPLAGSGAGLGMALPMSPPLGGHSDSFSAGPTTGELDFGSTPSNMVSAQPSGFVPGHGRRDSRGSISSLSGWGTNSGQYVQNAIPSTTTIDLAQATSQLAQLTAFRASAGHAKVPSFGTSGAFFGNNQATNSPAQQQRKSLFAPYLPAASIPPLVAAGKLVIGTLRVNKRNRSDAYVASEALDADIYICGSKDRNRALEGDVVAVELLDVDEVWGTKKEKEEKKRKKEEIASYDPRNAATASSAAYLRKQDKKNDDVEVEGQGMTLFDDLDDNGPNEDVAPQYAGHVVGVVHRTPGQLFAGTLGVLRPSSAATKEKQEAERREREGVDLRAGGTKTEQPVRIVWLRPVDKRVPLLAIPVNEAPSDFVENAENYANRLFCACIKRWPITSLHPFGTLVEELGPIGDIETETAALLRDCNFSSADFNESVIKCLPPIPYTIPPREFEVRRDLRDTRVFTIDPSSAKDLDDAISITRLEGGNYEIGVHIADVSHFIKLNTPLDREARKRGTTVYLAQKSIPMLPDALMEVCSLTPGEDKLAFSVLMTVTPEARLVSTWQGKTIIRSCAKLSYETAEEVIKGEHLPEDMVVHSDQTAQGIEEDVLDMMALARQVRKQRLENNALKIDRIRLGFTLAENDLPTDCYTISKLDSNALIEEFMLMANTCIAQKIAAGLPDHALLRRHEGPFDRRLEAFQARAKRLGYNIDISSAGSLMHDLEKIKETDDVAYFALKMLATKTMRSAKYFCSGMLDITKYHHYALNVPVYTHFTSPIRRYADIMVHRQLEAILAGTAETKLNLDMEAISQIAQQCNIKKEAARLASDQSQHLFLCTLIHELTTQFGPVVRPARVIGVLDESFDVVVPEFGIEKRVHVDQMPIENYVFDEHANTLAIYWKKGVDVVKWLAEHSGDAHLQLVKQNAEHHAKLMETTTGSHSKDESALFEEDEAGGASQQHKFDVNASKQAALSAKKFEPIFQGVEITKTGHHVQTVRELQQVPVIITADMGKSPPVLKVISLNPFQ